MIVPAMPIKGVLRAGASEALYLVHRVTAAPVWSLRKAVMCASVSGVMPSWLAELAFLATVRRQVRRLARRACRCACGCHQRP
jgi:hypothetical protein